MKKYNIELSENEILSLLDAMDCKIDRLNKDRNKSKDWLNKHDFSVEIVEIQNIFEKIHNYLLEKE